MQSNKFPFMGIYIDELDTTGLVIQVFELIEKREPVQVVGVNVDQIVRVSQNETSLKIFNNSRLIFIDGKPIEMMCKILGHPAKRITGPDLMEKLCQEGAAHGYKIFLLGAGPGVAAKCGAILEKKYPGIKVVGSYSPPFGFEKDQNEINRINDMLKTSGADMLFVGMGSPKQDIFIYENMEKYQIPVSFSMGAALDFIAGNIERAPRWMINCGLEWVHRISQNPKRLWKRYLVDDMAIVPLFFKELFSKK